MKRRTRRTSVWHRVVVVLIVALTSLVTGTGVAAADEEGHFHEKFTENIAFPATVGFNPCTGELSQDGFLELNIRGEIEVEDGEVHEDIAIRGRLHLDNGFQAKSQEEHNAQIDANGNGIVEIQVEFDVVHPESGDNFSVHVKVLLTLSDGEVVDENVQETIGECQTG